MTAQEARLTALERKDRQRSLYERSQSLRACGYFAYLVSDDEKEARRETCSHCGLRGLNYSGLACFEPGFSYIRFFSCRRCGTWVEC